MKINVDSVVHLYNGSAVKNEKGNDARLSELCIIGLSHPPDHPNAGDSYKRHALAVALFKGGEVELESSDVTFIKECAGRTLSPLVYGAVADLLEGKK